MSGREEGPARGGWPRRVLDTPLVVQGEMLGAGAGCPGKRAGIDPQGLGRWQRVTPHRSVCPCADSSWQGCTCCNVSLAPGLMLLLPPSPSPRDQLNALRREKQKLVEKIMDQYRVLEPGPLPRTK